MIRHQIARSTASIRFLILSLCASGVLFAGSNASAIELDWSGQFRAEYNFIHDYGMDNTVAANNFDPTRDPNVTGGYYIPSGGNSDATFETLFLKLRPKLVVNDNIYIKSELWLGNPIYGVFGNAVTSSTDQRQFYSNQSAGSLITAQRVWAEFLSDIGTVQVGRAPLNWGLGLVWNSGDGLWDRYESTGDTIRLISKFGAFSVMPSFVMYSAGNNVGGALPVAPGTAAGTGSPYLGNVINGDGGVREYTLALKYENLDDELEGGINFIKRLGGAAQDQFGYLGIQQSPVSFNYNIWDIYAKKRLGKFNLGAEVPITTGSVGGGTNAQTMNYATFALAAEVDWKMSDTWELLVKGGHAPGQPSWGAGTSPGNLNAFFFNPAYRLGLIMFNYALQNFAGPNTSNNPNLSSAVKSPYDNPIVNANYLVLNPMIHTDKWTFDAKFIYAQADQTASSGNMFLNTNTRNTSPIAAVENQSSSLGFETDLGATFQWDEYFQFRLETGIFLPGAYYAFSNGGTSAAPVENLTSPVYAISAAVGVNF